MVERVRIVLEAPEYRALLQLAQQEMRPLPQQIRLIICDDLKRRGLWPANQHAAPTATPEVASG